MAREIRGVSASGTLYARIMNPAGLWYNGSTFEAYSAGNYSTYDVAMTEQGNSGVYVADFPTAITTWATYETFIHRQTGGSPAEADPVVNTGKIDWTGTQAIAAAAGSMSGSDFRAYLLRKGFKRTDKDTEVYEAVTDAVQILRRRFMFDEAEADATTTDTISTLGDFRLSLETDQGLLLNIKMQDGTNAHVLEKRAKHEFDELYPDIHVTADRGYPRHFSVYAGSIYLGPIPDSTAYAYRLGYSKRAGTVTSSTTGVPFTDVYRDVLAELCLSLLFRAMQEYDEADRHLSYFEAELLQTTRREKKATGAGTFAARCVDC